MFDPIDVKYAICKNSQKLPTNRQSTLLLQKLKKNRKISHFTQKSRKFTQIYAKICKIMQITQKKCQLLRIFTQKLRQITPNYAKKRRNYAKHGKLCKNYAYITQKLRYNNENCAKIRIHNAKVLTKLCQNYADIRHPKFMETLLSNNLTPKIYGNFTTTVVQRSIKVCKHCA